MSQNQAPGWPDDETLLAFADGQLPLDEAEKVARFLDANEEARRFVERLRISGAMAKGAYDEAMRGPVPDKLEALLKGEVESQAEAAGVPAENVVALPLRPKRVSFASRYALPMAASIALLVGAVSGFLAGRQWPVADGGTAFDVAIGPVGKDTAVARLLEQRPSGDPISAGNAVSMMVVASFRDRDGRVCRELEVSPGDATGASTIGAVACRRADGAWHVEGAARMAAPSRTYSPASSGDALAIQGILQALGAKMPLSAGEEDALLKSGWK